MSEKISPSNEGLRNKSILDLQDKLEKEINRAAQVARQCNLWDLRYLIHLLRVNRMAMLGKKDETTQPYKLMLDLHDDALKYAIALTAKYGSWHDSASIGKGLVDYDDKNILQLMETTRKINGMFDHAMFLNVSELVNNGTKDGSRTWKLSDDKKFPERALERNFGLRIEHFAMSGKNETVNVAELICQLLQKYGRIPELFESGNNISLLDFCTGLGILHTMLVNRFKSYHEGIKDKDEICNPLSYEEFVINTRLMIFTDAEMEGMFEPEFIKYLHDNSYDARKLSDSELRFNYISRMPFLRGEGFMILSPELIFDSIIDNCHYTLLENEASKDAYQALYGKQFVDQVAKSAEKAGYTEKDRDVFLGSARNTIGDIDLVLQNPQTGHTLFIECKNHKLPLDVQFRATGKVLKHIESTVKWEKKVLKRIDHLKGNSPDYQVEGEWDYVIVTFMPQPLSHQSPLLIMTINEFDFWLSRMPRASCFPELFKAIYEDKPMQFTESDLELFRDAKFSFIKPVIKK